jgi:hypothetical protein
LTNDKDIQKDDKKYWHEIPQAEVEELINSGATYQQVIDNYKQPDWCSYPEALMGVMGCNSLTDNSPGGIRGKICEAYCSSCDCYRK